MRNIKKKGMLILGFIFVFAFSSIVTPDMVKAEEGPVYIFNTSNYDGGRAVMDILEAHSVKDTENNWTIKFEPGTYNIEESLILYSNTTIEATGATLKYVRNKSNGGNGRAPMLSNYCVGKGGYDGASNIVINGGTWDLQGSKGQVNEKMTMEAFRFMHGKNITFSNLTMQNLKKSHYITIEGLDTVDIKNCTFKDYKSPTSKKEAIHIDCMHNDSMAPSNQENTKYDDTICNNITVDGCTFNGVPRGVGTHIAVGGLYPSNVKFTNNKFENITYEAIKAYHYKNVTITGNTIKNAGCGIKAYLYAEPDDNDKDEEGSENFLPALKGTKTEGVPSNANVVISQNTISNITSGSVGFGIHIAGNASRPIQGVTVSDNNISSTKLSGIYAKYSNKINANNNKVNKAGGPLVLLSECRNSTVEKNNIASSSKDALIVQNSWTSTVVDNIVSDATKHAIYMNNVSNATVSRNNTSKDKSGGIGTLKCKNVQVCANTINGSGKNAIVIEKSAGANVAQNTVTKAKNFGVFVFSSNNAAVSKNIIDNSKSTGIVTEKGTGVKVKFNKVKKPGKYGILFAKTIKSSASSNTITSAKNISLCYAKTAKNRKLNLYFLKLDLKSGAKSITGRVIKKVKVEADVDGKVKKKTASKGKFKIGTKKLKKGTTVKFTLRDSYNNEAVIYRKVK